MDERLLLEPVVILKKLSRPFIATIKENDTADNYKREFLSSSISCSVSDGNVLKNDSAMNLKETNKPTRPFQCTLCTRTFSSMNYLKRHMLSHTNEKPHKCDYCEKRFASRSQLVQHQRIHTNERPYKCKDCDMAFRQSGHLIQHSRAHNSRRLPIGVGYERTSDSKLHVCTVCDKSFSTNRSLKAHTRNLHTGETPYKCRHCCEEFPSHQKYYYHLKSRHEERKHECPDCGMRFSISWNLKSHRLLHSNSKHYVCSECDGRFVYAKDLKIHLLRHADGPQTCHVCGQILSNPLRLKFHIGSHLLNKFFSCGECGKQFMNRAAVVHHFDGCHTQNKRRKSNSGSILNGSHRNSKLT